MRINVKLMMIKKKKYIANSKAPKHFLIMLVLEVL